jgi:large subunit ribosomal protein L15
MIGLHKLTGLLKKRKRVGRGGKLGGTSGKGHKGQKARSGGYVRIGYEGGQMPLYRRLPKRGFNNAQFQQEVKVVNLADLERVFESGATVTREALIEKGLIKVANSAKGSKAILVKILGTGELTKKLDVSADAFSKSAEKAIQDCGGQARLIKEM